MQDRSDEQLVMEYRKGDELALHELVRRHTGPIHAFINKYVQSPSDAEDLTQDVFLSVWKNIRRFDCEKSFKAWIFTIARNASLNWLKKKKPDLFSRMQAEEAFEELLSDPSPLPDELFHHADLKNRLGFALQKLDSRSRKVVSLHAEDFTFAEIGEMVGESLNTVKSRYYRALAALRQLL